MSNDLDVLGGPREPIPIPKFHYEEPDKGDYEARAILNWVENYWITKAEVPSIDAAVQAGIGPELYGKWISSIPFRKKLQGRGVGISSGEPGEFRPGGLSPLQMDVIQVMTDLLDGRSQKIKLQELQVNTQTYNNWLHDPVFVAALHARTESQLQSHKHEALMALMDNVKSGDNVALKMYFEMTGRFVSAKDKVNNINPFELIEVLVETLMEETKDRALVQRVGEKLMGVIAKMTAQDVASGGTEVSDLMDHYE